MARQRYTTTDCTSCVSDDLVRTDEKICVPGGRRHEPTQGQTDSTSKKAGSFNTKEYIYHPGVYDADPVSLRWHPGWTII